MGWGWAVETGDLRVAVEVGDGALGVDADLRVNHAARGICFRPFLIGQWVGLLYNPAPPSYLISVS